MAQNGAEIGDVGSNRNCGSGKGHSPHSGKKTNPSAIIVGFADVEMRTEESGTQAVQWFAHTRAVADVVKLYVSHSCRFVLGITLVLVV